MASTLEWVHKDIGVIKITGKPDNIKQINIFLPIKYVLKKKIHGHRGPGFF
jgi:hypothetical protein